ncbi:MAG: DGQHR domain-containing protein [Acidobacteria bacterium]|nr:DGQHR domain-containing protein [Acidobacteriota bacterium]
MISVAAIRMQQFGVQFYQASLTASDIDKLVRFEVLSYVDQAAGVRGRKRAPQAKINWDLLEKRIASSEKAYQRQIIRKKIDELVQYYEQCRQARDLPSIPGAVIISADEKLTFEPVEPGSLVGRLKVPEREGILRAIDGQHRLLALHADIDRFGDELFTVPAIIFDRLPEDHVVQMFVTINAKHTRLNASHLVTLSGRQLYRDEALAAAHDVVRVLNDREESPLHGDIKLLGVGKGRVAQAPIAQELKRLFANADALGGARKLEDFREESKRFFVNYFKQIANIFEPAWNGRKYSIKSAAALRAFIRVAPDVIKHIDQLHQDRADSRAIGRVIAPWGRRIGSLRFETDGAWKRQGSVDALAKELRLALQYPEGANL